jgi:hypothetical protein
MASTTANGDAHRDGLQTARADAPVMSVTQGVLLQHVQLAD